MGTAMGELAAQGHLDLGDQQLEYRFLQGRPDRPTLVLLHEGLGCVAIWRDFPDALAQATGCPVLVYSRAGYGGSSPVTLPRPLTYMHHEGQDVLPRLINHLGLTDYLLIGHSDGASIAVIYAGSAPRPGLRGVILEAPHVFNEPVCVASIQAAKQAYESTDLRAKLARLHGDNVDCAFWGWNGAWLDPGFLDWNLESFLPGIQVPMLVIQGASDEYGTARQYTTIADRSGAPVDVLVLAQCGHSPHRDRRDAALGAMVDFIRIRGTA